MQVDLGGFEGLVPEPEGDDRLIDSGAEQLHGVRVSLMPNSA
jgi:hypothetical protein